MALRDLTSNLDGEHSLAPAVYTATTNGAGVDLRGSDSAMIAVHSGAYTDGSHVVTLQESDDDSTYTDVADADIQGAEPTIDAAGDANSVFQFGYIGTSRYVRVITTVTGATSGAAYAACVVRGHLHRKPEGYSVESVL